MAFNKIKNMFNIEEESKNNEDEYYSGDSYEKF